MSSGPYVPEKDPVQETVSALKIDQSLKTTIGVDAGLCLPIWHCRTRKAFLMHVSSALDAIKKWGTKGLFVNDIKQACPSVQTIVHSKWLMVNGRMEEIQE
jgi:hypothetical protein